MAHCCRQWMLINSQVLFKWTPTQHWLSKYFQQKNLQTLKVCAIACKAVINFINSIQHPQHQCEAPDLVISLHSPVQILWLAEKIILQVSQVSPEEVMKQIFVSAVLMIWETRTDAKTSAVSTSSLSGPFLCCQSQSNCFILSASCAEKVQPPPVLDKARSFV